MIDLIEALESLNDRISDRQNGPVVLDELTKDIIAFRESLAELVNANIRFAFALSVPQKRIGLPLEDLLSHVSSSDVPKARIVSGNAITMIELLMIVGDVVMEKDLNNVCALFATEIVETGIMLRLREAKEIIRSIVYSTGQVVSA